MMSAKSYWISMKQSHRRHQQFGDGCVDLDINIAPEKSHFMWMATREPSSSFIGRNSHGRIFIEARAILSSMSSGFQG
jgi:hypothetical protein